MPFVPVAKTAMAELRFELDSQRVENTLYFENPVGWDITSMEALAADLITWWSDNMAPNLCDGLSLREVWMTDISDETAPAFGYSTGLPVAGLLSEEPLPNNVAVCISFRTSNRGRSARGRNYIAGIPSTSVTQNTITAGFRSALEDAYALLIPLAAANGATWIVASRYANGAPRVAGVKFLIRQALVTDATVDSQRRRLPGRGM